MQSWRRALGGKSHGLTTARPQAASQPTGEDINIYEYEQGFAGWPRSMGSGGSKHEENNVADLVDKSNITTSDFTILKLHGATGSLIAGSVATVVVMYVVYRAVLWRRERMRAEQGDRGMQAGMGVGGPVLRELPLHNNGRAHCDVCGERGINPRERDLHGHFQAA